MKGDESFALGVSRNTHKGREIGRQGARFAVTPWELGLLQDPDNCIKIPFEELDFVHAIKLMKFCRRAQDEPRANAPPTLI